VGGGKHETLEGAALAHDHIKRCLVQDLQHKQGLGRGPEYNYPDERDVEALWTSHPGGHGKSRGIAERALDALRPPVPRPAAADSPETEAIVAVLWGLVDEVDGSLAAMRDLALGEGVIIPQADHGGTARRHEVVRRAFDRNTEWARLMRAATPAGKVLGHLRRTDDKVYTPELEPPVEWILRQPPPLGGMARAILEGAGADAVAMIKDEDFCDLEEITTSPSSALAGVLRASSCSLDGTPPRFPPGRGIVVPEDVLQALQAGVDAEAAWSRNALALHEAWSTGASNGGPAALAMLQLRHAFAACAAATGWQPALRRGSLRTLWLSILREITALGRGAATAEDAGRGVAQAMVDFGLAPAPDEADGISLSIAGVQGAMSQQWQLPVAWLVYQYVESDLRRRLAALTPPERAGVWEALRAEEGGRSRSRSRGGTATAAGAPPSQEVASVIRWARIARGAFVASHSPGGPRHRARAVATLLGYLDRPLAPPGDDVPGVQLDASPLEADAFEVAGRLHFADRMRHADPGARRILSLSVISRSDVEQGGWDISLLDACNEECARGVERLLGQLGVSVPAGWAGATPALQQLGAQPTTPWFVAIVRQSPGTELTERMMRLFAALVLDVGSSVYMQSDVQVEFLYLVEARGGRQQVGAGSARGAWCEGAQAGSHSLVAVGASGVHRTFKDAYDALTARHDDIPPAAAVMPSFERGCAGVLDGSSVVDRVLEVAPRLYTVDSRALALHLQMQTPRFVGFTLGGMADAPQVAAWVRIMVHASAAVSAEASHRQDAARGVKGGATEPSASDLSIEETAALARAVADFDDIVLGAAAPPAPEATGALPEGVGVAIVRISPHKAGGDIAKARSIELQTKQVAGVIAPALGVSCRYVLSAWGQSANRNLSDRRFILEMAGGGEVKANLSLAEALRAVADAERSRLGGATSPGRLTLMATSCSRAACYDFGEGVAGACPPGVQSLAFAMGDCIPRQNGPDFPEIIATTGGVVDSTDERGVRILSAMLAAQATMRSYQNQRTGGANSRFKDREYTVYDEDDEDDEDDPSEDADSDDDDSEGEIIFSDGEGPSPAGEDEDDEDDPSEDADSDDDDSEEEIIYSDGAASIAPGTAALREVTNAAHVREPLQLAAQVGQGERGLPWA